MNEHERACIESLNRAADFVGVPVGQLTSSQYDRVNAGQWRSAPDDSQAIVRASSAEQDELAQAGTHLTGLVGSAQIRKRLGEGRWDRALQRAASDS